MKRTACLVAILIALVPNLGAQPVRRFTQKELEEFDLQRIKRKIPQPETLEDFIRQVQGLKDLGADNAEIAEHMSNAIDKRLKADNRPWDESLDIAAMRTWGVRSIGPIKRLLEEYKQRWAPLDALRNAEVQATEPHPVDDGQLYAATAPVAWESGLGNCSESASVAYFALKDVGIPARIFASCAGGGHEFVVIGLAANADPNDPNTWGPEARVVDGWTGHALTPEQAFANAHFLEVGPATGLAAPWSWTPPVPPMMMRISMRRGRPWAPKVSWR